MFITSLALTLRERERERESGFVCVFVSACVRALVDAEREASWP